MNLDILGQNFILNSNTHLWQRASAPSFPATNIPTTLAYNSIDRFLNAYTGSVIGNPTIQAETSTVPFLSRRSIKVGFRRSGAFTFILEHRIESFDAEILARYGRASFGLEAISQASGMTVRLTLLAPNNYDNHSTQNQFYQSTSDVIPQHSWTRVKFENVSISPIAARGLAIKYEFIFPHSIDESVLYLYLGQFMACAGKVLAPYRMAGRNIADELQMCQRFFEKSYNIDVPPGTVGYDGSVWLSSWTENTGYTWPTHKFLVRKRVSPTMYIYNPENGAFGELRRAFGPPGTSFANSDSAWSTNESGFNINQGGVGSSYLQYRLHFTADSEIV